jgi:disulfide bond formation protein DsbB
MKLLSYLLMVIAMLLALTLSGCGGKELKVVAAPQQRPPSTLLDDCDATPFNAMTTNAEILISFQTLWLDFKECNKKKKLLRDWYDLMETQRKAALEAK